MSSSLGTLAISANTNTKFQAPNNGVKAILIGNESGLTVTITMESGGVQKTLYPSTIDWFQVNRGFTGNIKIAPAVILNNVATFPSSSLIFDAIGLNDPENASMYPLALPRNTNIGNQVSTVGGVANSIQNDNSVAGTLIAESTVSGDSGSAVSLLNSGHLSLGTVNNPGVLTVIPVLGTSQQVQVDGNGVLTVNKSIAANLIKTVTGNDFTIDVETGHKVALQVNNTDVVDVDATNGLTLLAGKLNLLLGSLSRIKISGPFNLSTSGVSCAHGLGVVPDFVIPINDAGNSTGAIAHAVNFGGMTTTNVTVYSASSTPSVRLLAIKL